MATVDSSMGGTVGPATGIVVYRASRLEALLDPLIALLDSSPPASTLAPQTVIAAHPGMRQWLLGALARKRGAGGIVANLDVVLPSMWLDRLAQSMLGDTAQAQRAYRREFLRWRIHDALDGLHDERIDAYLHGQDPDRRRFQLADRLALIYSQYLVYRPDWLEAWSAGRRAHVDAGFLAPLWKRLRSAIGHPHRGERLARLVAMLVRIDTGADDTPLHVFGISHLAPTELAVLRAVARHRLVVFYVPDPCREFWAGMPNERMNLHQLAQRELDADGPEAEETESAFLQLDHPLLAKWGRIGQHFLLLLEDSDVAIDVRHHLDQPEAAIEPANRLQWLQEGIRRAQPGLPLPRSNDYEARADSSLRIHACHTRLRELEVLRDALLAQLKLYPELKPSDILVMAPDIQAYAPLLPAVFGEAGRHQGPLPYHLADVAIARAHPLLEAFARLLDLPRSRMTAPEVVDLLALAPVAQRFGLDDGDIGTIASWLRNGRVAWGLDPGFRARFDVPPIAEQTFAWGMDRMLAGYALGQDDADALRAVDLPDGSVVLPLDGVSGPQAAALGVLDEALVEFTRWCGLASRTQRASAWSRQLEERMLATLRIDAGDRAGREAWDTLLHAIRALAGEPDESGLDPPLAFEVVREWLNERLAAVSGRQRFLMGGATFCGMVPQRAIPFGVVAVLGLDDGAFPRSGNDAGLDPMGTHRRLGDRDVRNDDRYLFLQTVMSARTALHLSYIGCGVRDGKSRNPAAPLADLLAMMDGQAGLASEEGDSVATEGAGTTIHRRPWLVRHPLQPFDDRYFDGTDPALFSFRHEFALMGAPASWESASPEQKRPGEIETLEIVAPEPEAAAGERAVSLREVLAYYRDPAKVFLTRHVNLRLDALADDRLSDSERLEPGFDRIERVGRRLFFQAIASATRELPARPPDWLRLGGLLPAGSLGTQTWDDEVRSVGALLDSARTHPLFANGMPERAPTPPSRAIGRYRIEGELARAYRTHDALWVFDVFPGKDESDLDFRQRIGLFLEWALLRLDEPEASGRVRLYALCGARHPWQDAINHWDAGFVDADGQQRTRMIGDLRGRVLMLLDRWWSLQSDPQWYFPKTSWKAAKAKSDAASDAAASAWNDYDGKGERNFASGYERALAGEAMFERGSVPRRRLDAIATELLDAITLSPDAEVEA